jgi:hypothetical protein
VIDKGLSLREAISKDVYQLYFQKSEELSGEYHSYDANDERVDFLKKKIRSIGELMHTLKKTNEKNNIMREAMELFYDGDFLKKMDTNEQLLCFNNGVIDLYYEYSKDTHKDLGGRLYSSNGIQGVSKVIRGFLASNTTDIDIKNAHPVILNYICKKHDIPCAELEYYIKNREMILSKFDNSLKIAFSFALIISCSSFNFSF